MDSLFPGHGEDNHNNFDKQISKARPQTSFCPYFPMRILMYEGV
jgi:hypothetical protein